LDAAKVVSVRINEVTSYIGSLVCVVLLNNILLDCISRIHLRNLMHMVLSHSWFAGLWAAIM